MRLVHRARELIMHAFRHTRPPLVETAQYYVAAIVGHPDRDEAVYGLLRLSPKEAAHIKELDRRLAAGDGSVRQERQRFFDARKAGCMPVFGKMGRGEIGDLIPVAGVELALGTLKERGDQKTFSPT